MKRPLPTFIVIGAMRSGTSSLYNYLQRHPEILMSQIRETDFFARTELFKQGKDAYRRFFRPTNVKVIGDVCSNYSKFPFIQNIPERLQGMLPRAKLIYLARHPLERMLSHYFYSVLEGHEDRDLNTALFDPGNNEYFAVSRYKLQLEQYKNPQKILVMPLDQLEKNRKQALKQIYNHIGVSWYWHSDFEFSFHRTQDRLDVYSPSTATILRFTGELHRGEFLLDDRKAKSLMHLFEPDIQYVEAASKTKLPQWRSIANFKRWNNRIAQYLKKLEPR
jgi:hypothetical protein